jgi:CBS domain-containing protein
MLTAADIMTTDVAIIRSSATIAEAVKLMRERGLRSLIVDRMHEQDAYGMIAETDVVYKVAAYGADPKQMRVYEIMTKPCIVVNPELGIEHVARLFADLRISRAPVIQGTLLGIVSVSDILTKGDFDETPQTTVLDQKIQTAIEYARSVCQGQGNTSQECLAAWTTVEEMQTAAAHQRNEVLKKTAFDEFCEEYPEVMEKRVYEAWCGG